MSRIVVILGGSGSGKSILIALALAEMAKVHKDVDREYQVIAIDECTPAPSVGKASFHPNDYYSPRYGRKGKGQRKANRSNRWG